MQTTTLRNTGLTVSRICLGTMTFGGQADKNEAARILGRALEAGVNFLDTANVYANGRSEVILGDVLKGRRHDVSLASKVGIKAGDGPDEKGLSRRAILRAVEQSLQRLRTDYLDVYYFHTPDYSTPIEESLETMEQLVREGKVRYPASSNFSSWQVCRMLWLAEKNGFASARITQPMYNLLARGIEQEYLPMARELGVSTVVYNPLAGGLLTGKHRAAEPLAGTRFDKNQLYLDRYWHEACHAAVEQLNGIAQRAGRSLIGLSLNWLLHHTPADCLILGASRLEQLDENLRALEEGRLPEDVVKGCDAVWAELRGVTPKYNR